MDVFVVIGLKDFSVSGHLTIGEVAQRVSKHRNTVSDALKTDAWVKGDRVVIGDYVVILVSIEKRRDRGSPPNNH
jgi:hypothetical protein